MFFYRYPVQEKILLLGANLAQGGAQAVLMNLAAWIHQQKVPVVAAFMYDRDGLASEWQAAHPFPVMCLDAWQRGGSDLRRMIKFTTGWLRLVGWMRRERFSAILTFTHDMNLVGLPAAWLAGIPCRYASHHNRYPSLTASRIRLHRWIMNSWIALGLVAVSRFTQAEAVAEGIDPKRVIVIDNGVAPLKPDAAQASALRNEMLAPAGTRLVLSVGRLVPQKAQQVLIQAAEIVIRSFPWTRFVIAGEGPEREALQSQIAQSGLGEGVRLLGARTDIPELLAASDLFVLSSSSEGMPVALLEAMASGLAVVTTRVGGMPDVISDGETGILVPPQDPFALAGAICKVLQDDDLRLRLGLSAKALIEKEFSLEKMGKKYLDLLSCKSSVNIP